MTNQPTPAELRQTAHLAARDAGGLYLPGEVVAHLHTYLDQIVAGDQDAQLVLAGYLRAALDQASAEQTPE